MSNPYNPQAARQYLKTRVLTATPEQLQLMLYDGAVRFCEQAKIALLAKNYEQAFNGISRAQNIVAELMSALKPDLYPELCDKLMAIYRYVYKLLIDACINHKTEPLEESISLLQFQRETWALVLEQVAKTKASTAARSIAMPAPDDRMEASISMSA